MTDSIENSKSKTQKYYYDGENIIAVLDADNNLTASYTYLPLRPDDVLGAKFTSSAISNGLRFQQVEWFIIAGTGMILPVVILEKENLEGEEDTENKLFCKSNKFNWPTKKQIQSLGVKNEI